MGWDGGWPGVDGRRYTHAALTKPPPRHLPSLTARPYSSVARFIKRKFDKDFSPTWHCFIGKEFGAQVTHETKSFIYFVLGPLSILLFRSG